MNIFTLIFKTNNGSIIEQRFIDESLAKAKLIELRMSIGGDGTIIQQSFYGINNNTIH